MNTINPTWTLIVFFILFSSLILSCKEELPEVIEPEKFEWNRHPAYPGFRARVYNMAAGPNDLKVYGENSCSTITKDNAGEHIFSSVSGIDLKLPASDLIRFVGQRHVPVIRISKWCFASQFNNFYYDFSEDSLFEEIAYSHYFPGRANTIGFDGKSTFLIPARGKIERPFFYLVALDTIQTYPGNNFDLKLELDTLSRIIIEEEIMDNMEIVNIEYINEHFFVSFYGGSPALGAERTYRVGLDQSYQKVSDLSFNEFFVQGDHLYGTRRSSIYQSNLDGDQWVEKYIFDTSIISQVSFKVIEGEIYYYASSYIGKLELTPDGGSMRQLKNDGLEESNITSIEKFQDKLYVTTYAGLFWAEMDELAFAE